MWWLIVMVLYASAPSQPQHLRMGITFPDKYSCEQVASQVIPELDMLIEKQVGNQEYDLYWQCKQEPSQNI